MTTVSSFLPLMPPAALMRSTAVSTPSRTMSPYWVTAPVVGPTTPILMVCACAPALNANPAATPSAAMTGVRRNACFMSGLL